MAQAAAATVLEKTDSPTQENAELLAKCSGFLKHYVPAPDNEPRDTLEGRYRIQLSARLPEYDSKTGRAYAVSDSKDDKRQLFALICQPSISQRHAVIKALKNVKHPNLLQLVAAGLVHMSQPDEQRFVIIYERPRGKKMSELLRTNPSFRNEVFILKNIIAPLGSAIQQLSDVGVSHGYVHPDNIYLDETPILGDCLSEPCGYAQPFYFESLERMQAHPAGKGEGSTAQDYYALAVLILYILHGPQHFNLFTPHSLENAILKEGVYAALTRQKDVPEIFYDFFRGMLSQTIEDRWNYRYLKPWLDGKRYNVLLPPPQAEAARAFEFAGGEANTRRELAQLFFSDWKNIPKALENDQLWHWVSVSLRNKELAEQVERISRSVSESRGKNEVQLNEQLMRLLMLLDPAGPLRIANLAFHVDGIDTLCIDLFMNKAEKELQLLAKFIEFNMITFWLDYQRKHNDGYTIPPALNTIMLRMDRLRVSMRNTSLGFGLERMLYELNPELPCLSPHCAGHYITTLPALLKHLDRIAPNLSKNEDPIDRHIAAFLATKLSLQHNIHLPEVEEIPGLAGNRAMFALKLLSSAQNRSKDITLPGLTSWLALRILPGLDNVRSNILRRHMKSKLVDVSSSGYTQILSELLLHPKHARADLEGFNEACRAYRISGKEIESYKQREDLDQLSLQVGSVMSRVIAYSALGLTLYSIIMHA